MVTTLQTASSDATVYGSSPDRVWSNISYLTVASGGAGRRPFIYFNNPVPLGATVSSAILRLTQQRAADVSASRTLNAEPVAGPWLESKITWNNAPGVGALDAFAEPLPGVGFAGRVVEFDVTAIMQAVADGAAWYGFRITSDNANILPLNAREAGAGAPSLEVTWTDEPQQPTKLSPAGGRAVSIARPTFSFDYTDLSATTSTMAAYQVQLNDSNVWTSPDVDTGEVAASVPLHTLTSDVAIDEVVWWRARVKDDSGLWSPWSDGVSFTRKAKVTVTITNPAASPNDYVTEPTPPFSWTAADQVAYRVLVTDALDPTAVRWDSGKVTATDQTTTPPADLPLTTGGSYRVEVRVFDDVAREGTPGDPAYATAERTFTYQLVDEVAPVDDLAVEQVDERPWATLTWSSATAPDGFEIVRRVVETGAETSLGVFEAADLFTGSEGPTTVYSWAGTPHASASIKTVDAVEVDRNYCVDPSGETAALFAQQGSSNVPAQDTLHVRSGTYSTKLNRGVGVNNIVGARSVAGSLPARTAGRKIKCSFYMWAPSGFAGDHGISMVGAGISETATATTIVTAIRDDLVRVQTEGTDTGSGGLSVQVRGGDTAHDVWVDDLKITYGLAGHDHGEYFDGDTPDVGPVQMYEFVDRQADPRIAHEWEVRRIVNGETSDDNPAVELTIETTGAWLCSIDGAHAVNIKTEGRDTDPIRWNADERIQKIRPHNATQVHVVTGGVFGREGRLSGFVTPWSGQTLAEARAAVAALRPRRPGSDVGASYGTPMVLSQVDECIQVFWTGVWVDRGRDLGGRVTKFEIGAELNEIP